MIHRGKRLLEAFFFLVTCCTTFALWFVPMALPLEVLLLLIGAGLPGRFSIGGGHACWDFLLRVPFYHRIAVVLLIVVAFVIDSAMILWVPNGERWIMVNGGLTAYLGLMELINAALYLLYLFVPNKLPLSGKRPKE